MKRWCEVGGGRMIRGWWKEGGIRWCEVGGERMV